MFKLYRDTFAACTRIVPERSFEPAIVAGMFREKVTAAWDEHKLNGQQQRKV
jgi:hypothetical protein